MALRILPPWRMTAGLRDGRISGSGNPRRSRAGGAGDCARCGPLLPPAQGRGPWPGRARVERRAGSTGMARSGPRERRIRLECSGGGGRERDDSDSRLAKVARQLQLLGLLVALAAAGLGAGRCAACEAPAPHGTSSVRSPEEVGEVDEEEAGKAVVAAEDADEAARTHAEFRDNPYAITVPLRIVGLRGSVPPVWLKEFMVSQGKRVKVSAEFRSSLQSIFSELSSAVEGKPLTSRSAMAADLVTIGDSWLAKAVSGGLITPIDNAEQSEWYQRMGPKWQTFVRRDEQGLVSSNGRVWAVPYRWGSLVMAYNHRKFQRLGIPPIQDWADLWNPELAGRIAMVASPREVVGTVLKSIGASYNVKDFEKDISGGRQAMKEKFLRLQSQVRLFDDYQYLKALGADEVWVAVGWSEDVIAFAKRTSNITVVAPRSGTSLWADLWAVPATTTIRSTKVGGRIRGPSPLISQWLDFCLQAARSSSFQHDVSAGASPLTLSEKLACSKSGTEGSGGPESSEERDSMSDTGQSISLQKGEESPVKVGGLLTPDVVAKSEFLEPLSEKALEDFRWLLSKRAVRPKFPMGFLYDLKRSFHSLTERAGIKV